MVEIRYLGHSAFQISGQGGSLIIDPFLTDNPLVDVKAEEVHPDLILLSHAHQDHLGDAIKISKREDAPILSTFEVAGYCESKGASAIPAHMGGTVEFEFCRVKLFPAWHSSSVDERDLGNPCSFVVSIDDRALYHSGDTALFGDMNLIGEQYQLDVAMLPIGGHFTMDMEDAVRAEKFLRADVVIPMHYGTFDVIEADPEEFCRRLKEETGKGCRVLGIGEAYSL